MTTFLAVYRGQTVSTAKLIAVTADPGVIAAVVDHFLDQSTSTAESDPAIEATCRGRRRALRIIRREAAGQPEVLR